MLVDELLAQAISRRGFSMGSFRAPASRAILLDQPFSVGPRLLLAIMNLIRFRWCNGLPSEEEIVRRAQGLVLELARDPDLSAVECGGLRASCDEDGTVRVVFEIELDMPFPMPTQLDRDRARLKC
jgi:hypothetical protein